MAAKAAAAPRKLTASRKISAVAGFLFLGLSPTYIEWQEHPERRVQIAGYYAVAVTLFYYGMLSG